MHTRRVFQARLSKGLGQAVDVDNEPGATGRVAMAEVVASTDQHTRMLGHIGTLAVNPFIFDKRPDNANKDFRPITLLASEPARPSNQPARWRV